MLSAFEIASQKWHVLNPSVKLRRAMRQV